MLPSTAMATCSQPGCNEPPRASGLCTRHYQQARRGRLGATRRQAPKGLGGYVRFRLDEALVATVQAIAERRGITTSQAYREAVAEWLERQTT